MPPTPATWDGQDSQGNPLRFDSGLTWDGFVPEPQPTKRMPQLRVLLGFTNAPDHSLKETAQAVLDKLYGNAAYPAPPVLQPVLQAALTAFSKAIVAADKGGPEDTAAKNNQRDALIALLRQLAGYVQGKHDNDLAKLLSSGFDAVSTNRTPAPMVGPAIRDILNGNSGQLILRVSAVRNSYDYEVRYAAIGAGGAPGPWQSPGIFTNSRSMPVNGLTSGTNYTFQVRAVSSGNNYSDWSDAVSHMSM